MKKNNTVWYSVLTCLLAFILFPGWQPEALATHIRAGEITAKSDTAANPNPLRYHFKLVTYVVTSSNIPDLEATFFFGDGTKFDAQKASEIQLPNNITRRVFYASHTYPAPGVYSVGYSEQNRNSSIINMNSPGTTSFHVRTIISINPQIGINRSPQFSVPPIDVAAQNQIFIHFPGAYDLDQDSLSYKMRIPQQNVGIPSAPVSANVSGYRSPESFGGTTVADPLKGTSAGLPTTFTLNEVTGEIRWNTPNVTGEYNIAFVVEEWKVIPGRSPVKLGEVWRDMQIKVEATLNKRPLLTIPKDTCVVAKTLLQAVVTGSDGNTPQDPITFNAYGGIFPPATFTQNSPNTALFRWTPQCTDISNQPYQVVFKVTDTPPSNTNEPRLIDMQAWNVTVVGPKPTGLTATPLPGKQMRLNWNPYLQNGCGNAQKIRIYRRENRANFVPSACETGVPASTGYVFINEVDASVTTYTDTNQGQGLNAGATYCYLIYATFPGPKNGESLASDEVCAEIPLVSSVLTNVSVTQTSKTAGQILVRWTRPVGGINNYPGPHEYRLYRATGLKGSGGFQQVHSTTNPNDTLFTDQNLNTQDSVYRYKVEFYFTSNGTLQLLDSSPIASSVRLDAISSGQTMQLTWRYNVPWNNEGKLHIIYREINGSFVAIDSVQAGREMGVYIDNGTFNNEPLKFGQQYCYFIETVGTYMRSKLPPVVRNNSEVFCQIVRDTTAPCAPVLSLTLLNCDSLERTPFKAPFRNKLKWQPATGNGCGNDVKEFNVYYRPTDDAAFALVGTTPATSFMHENLPTPAGCYVVTAVDSSGNESRFSNIACQDVCYFLELPNIITPNGDLLNDTFRPRNSAFIRSVKFTVYNRWGVKVYDQTTGPNIDWGGTSDNGTRLSDGVYYYLADIEFAGRNPQDSRRTFKGWVEILSNKSRE
ncbi:gliding motility-associated C-terminal domain-containing protein [Adhaeribacter sp. BT258]|uniref:Gliding motility-associated C-terminal domain-containing protein n=1 Tax=Adhaeribacter terrigena TaxID=2793070 RepID=A0ABS1BZ80_9BACT|nr:gliding motility-associated C-terminal domain-containing protein [Adhaeribacter terrigena]MBK0402231.1 gliding motility-associated C-terminal domain-containing protein [Adhaeribacter terrigena]